MQIHREKVSLVLTKTNRMIRFLLFLCAIVAFLFSSGCKTTMVSQPSEFEGPRFEFGSGGGITGLYNTYHLLQNGQLFKADAQGATKEIAQLSKADVKSIFTKAKKINLAGMDHNKPGNFNYFINYTLKGETTKTQWANKQEAPAGLVELYQQLSALTEKK